ncbi:Core-2/I-Branching enzyme, partial [Trichostrongylus colubriformis]
MIVGEYEGEKTLWKVTGGTDRRHAPPHAQRGWISWSMFQFLCYYFSTRLLKPYYEMEYADLLDRIEINCDGIFHNDPNFTQEAKLMQYNTYAVEKLLLDAEDRCFAIRSLFGFDRKPVSQEERDYPLAYGLIVYKNLVQTLFMLSSFYRPQNQYCIAVSGGADTMYKLLMDEVDKCFENIQVLHRPRIDWGSFEIINSTYECLKVLSKSGTPWKYFQYLSGVDIPLKTNREMVEILKAWNDTVNTEFTQFQRQRVRSKRIESAPLPLFKSSLSATVPRKAVDRIVQSTEARDLLNFLRNTSIPDESFWATLSGNVDSKSHTYFS